MRKEATLEQWRELYEVTHRIKEMEPWEFLEDMDLIGVRHGKKEDTIFYSIMGHYGSCYAIAVFEGYKGYNDLLKVAQKEELNLTTEQVMFSQANLTCYFGDRQEVSSSQYKVIKNLGYKYRGKNQWIYYVSYKSGYFPYDLDQEEVIKMTSYLRDLELALTVYLNQDIDVDFDNFNMFVLEFNEDKTKYTYQEEELPFTDYRVARLEIADQEYLEYLKTIEKNKGIIEVDAVLMATNIPDKAWDRPINQNVCVVADSKSGMILDADFMNPDTPVLEGIANCVIELIERYGRFKEIQVNSPIYIGALEHLCQQCDIKLRLVKRLPAIKELIKEMGRSFR